MDRKGVAVLSLVAGLGAGVIALGEATAGVVGVATVTESTESDSSRTKRLAASCPNDSFRTGGGAHVRGGDNNIAIVSTKPAGADAWKAKAAELIRSGDDWTLKVYAVCLEN